MQDLQVRCCFPNSLIKILQHCRLGIELSIPDSGPIEEQIRLTSQPVVSIAEPGQGLNFCNYIPNRSLVADLLLPLTAEGAVLAPGTAPVCFQLTDDIWKRWMAGGKLSS
jgi:hypothetical protein